jgi:hypothetical protein
VTLNRTESLARIVNPLSTSAFYGQLVSLIGAFVREWLFSRRNMLFDLLSFVCLASSSIPLRTYAVFPINYFCLASFRRPHCLATVVLTNFHILPEQSFAFVIQTRS